MTILRTIKNNINNITNRLLKADKLSLDKRLTQRPVFDLYFNQRAGIKQPDVSPTLPLLKYVHDTSPAIKIATMRLRETIFRKGFEWQEIFKSKCINPTCEKEFDKVVQKCDECGSNVITPNHRETKRAEDFFSRCNIYSKDEKKGKRKLVNLLKQIEDDINIYDDAYVIGIKEYWQNENGDVLMSTLHEIIRGNPVTMRIVADELGDRGGRWSVCLRHRDVVEDVGDEVEKRCRICGRKLYEVHYVSIEGGGDSPTAYYIGDEVIKVSKYQPSNLYGFSPIVTLWQHALTLTNMIEYVYRSYTEQHLPKGVLAMRTTNPDSAYEFWHDVDDKIQKNPHYIPKIFLEGEGNGTGSGMEFVKFMDTLEEMQYIPVRDEIRRTIASLYGVTNIFLGDTAGVGGLNAESEQIQITNMAAESGIQIYNEIVMPEILKWLNINDWKYVLKSPFDENKQIKLNENLTQTQIAQQMKSLGFDVKLGEKDIFEFTYFKAQTLNNNFGIQKYLGEQDDRELQKKFINELNKIFDDEMSKIMEGAERFTGEDLNRLIHKVTSDAIWKMKLQSNNHIRDLYMSGHEYVADLTKQAIRFDKVDELALKAITGNEVLWSAYADMEKSLSDKLNNIIFESYKEPSTFSLQNIVRKMQEEANTEVYKLERIVRTETRTASQKGREMGFKKSDPENTNKYFWAVRHDTRTSKVCKEIEQEVNKEGGGVSLQRLNEIIKEASLKYNGQNWKYRDWTPHINCRSGLQRRF